MRKLAPILIATALAAGLTGCDDDDAPDADFTGDLNEVAWQADLVGIGEFAAIRGEAQVMWIRGADAFTAGAEIHFDAPITVRPWHVHFGTCETGGDIVGPADAYPPLVTNTEGFDAVTVLIPAEIEEGDDYHVNVHLSAEELGTIIACGDLDLSGP